MSQDEVTLDDLGPYGLEIADLTEDERRAFLAALDDSAERYAPLALSRARSAGFRAAIEAAAAEIRRRSSDVLARAELLAALPSTVGVHSHPFAIGCEWAAHIVESLTVPAPPELCRLRLVASALGSICGRPFGHDGHCGDPIAATPRTPPRPAPTEET